MGLGSYQLFAGLALNPIRELRFNLVLGSASRLFRTSDDLGGTTHCSDGP